MTNPGPASESDEVVLATITVVCSITPDGEYRNSCTCTGEPGLATTLSMLTWAQRAIAHSAYHPTGEPE